jgi:hypothetical protein
MVEVKSPSGIGANWLVIAMKWVIFILSHNTIVITLMRTDWACFVGHQGSSCYKLVDGNWVLAEKYHVCHAELW